VPHEFTAHDLKAIEADTQALGRHVFSRRAEREPTILERRWWDDRIMAWAMQDESVKVQMFRFIDVLPMLGDSASVTRHLHEYFDEVEQHLPSAVRLGMAVATPGSLAGRAVAIAARRNALGHARRFIAGTNTAEVVAAAKRERRLLRGFTLDLLGEAVTSEPEAQRYLQQYLAMIDELGPLAAAWTEVPQVDVAAEGRLPRLNMSVKLTALDSQFDSLDWQGTTERVAARLRQILRAARRQGAHVHVDMESYEVKDLTLHIFHTVLAEDEFCDWPDVGIVIQCYLKDSGRDLQALRDWARARGTPVWVRLVKGAYWDYETAHAAAVGWPVPVYEQKWETDANYETQTRFLLQNYEHLRPALGSHNVRSLAHGIAVAQRLGLPKNAVELQMLYGMGDAEKQAFVDLGYRMRVYMPFGELIPGMAYLVRRLLENTSNDSFLRAGFAEDLPVEQLLMNPEHMAGRNTSVATKSDAPAPFRPAIENEPVWDFSLAEHRDRVTKALAEVRSSFGKHYPLVIDGRRVESAERITSTDPSETTRLIGTACAATAEQARSAVQAARKALPEWAALGAVRRAEYLRKTAAVLRRRRAELIAWEIYECGKTWREADADVCEAIDFCEYYAQGAIALEQAHGADVPGEENRFIHIPRGVAAVIAPWNFPLAILTGMTTAALATGNTVVMKPAEQSPVIAAQLMAAFEEVGLPPGVANYLPGLGETAGAALVDDPNVAVIAFTGSRAVGLAIHQRAAQVSASLSYVKRVIAEMGGKNAIIVDDDADLDEAVLGVMRSAFGYQGQKCSACSRTIVLSSVYDAFLARLVEATRSLKVGPADDPATRIGPVIDRESFDRVHKYIRLGREEGREVLATNVGDLAARGHYVGPHIFADVAPSARLAQEEIFGPVLAVIRAADFDEALRIANGTEYALTGGVFSRSPVHLDQARRDFLVGNLYLNRGTTGALVGRQPFGGFKMSGIGSQAGGPDYLLQFVLPRTVTENTMRRGFAPTTPADARRPD
jgi:RHH-type proline utilization regulon transcriptional repressor/proline dehydrogenase/delta 1-pyrroline-5-carboxylate dehydrogenase